MLTIRRIYQKIILKENKYIINIHLKNTMIFIWKPVTMVGTSPLQKKNLKRQLKKSKRGDFRSI